MVESFLVTKLEGGDGAVGNGTRDCGGHPALSGENRENDLLGQFEDTVRDD